MFSHPKLSFGVACLVALAAGPVLAQDVGQGEAVVVNPAQGRVGTRFDVTCKDFPEPTSFDTVYIAPAGTPDVDPYSQAARDEKILWKDYAANCYRSQGRFSEKAGPFAPGSYEARFITRLYNNDGRMEVSTRTPFTVR